MRFRKAGSVVGLSPLTLVACGALSQVWAQAVVPDGSTATSASTAASGRITVDIAPKNTSGTSLNRYTNFNVPTTGVDLNNATVGARTIINEVTSTNPSLLQGQLQVLGPRAHVIVANPNGITVDGGSFVNTGGVALSTGTISFVNRASAPGQSQDNPLLTTTDGLLVIGAGGLSGAMSHLELISKQLRIEGQVTNSNSSSAADIRATTGASSVEFDAGVFPTNPAAPWAAASSGGATSAGTVLVDISRPGGLSASRVQIAVTDAGAGVRSAGTLLASAQDFTLAATGDVQVSGSVTAKRDVVIDATTIAMTGKDDGSASTLSSGRHTDLLAPSVNIRATEITAGTAGTEGDVTLGKSGTAATGDLVVAGVQGAQGYTRAAITARGGLGLYAQGRDVTIEGASLEANGAAEVVGEQVTLRGLRDTDGTAQGVRLTGAQMTMNAGGALSMTGAELAGGAGVAVTAASITADALVNGSDVHSSAITASSGNVTLTTPGAVALNGSDVTASGNVKISAAGVTADAVAVGGFWQGGQISAQHGGLVIKANAGDILNRGNTLQGKDAIAGDADSLGGVTLNATGNVINRSLDEHALGIVFASEGDLSVTAGGGIENHAGRLVSNRNVTLSAGGDLVNVVEKTAAGGGTMTSSGSVKSGFWNRLFGGKSQSLSTVDYGSLTIPGTLAYVVANGNVSITSANLRNIGGEIDANDGDIAITTGALTTEALPIGRASVQVTCGFTCRTAPSGGVQLAGGTLSASRDIDVTATGTVLNKGGSMLAMRALTITAPSVRAEAITTWRAVAMPNSAFGTGSPRLLRSDQGGMFRALGGLVRLNTTDPVVIQGGVVDGSAGEEMPAGSEVTAPVTERAIGGGGRPIGMFH